MNHIPSIGRAWRRTFWVTYDHLGLMVILSLIWLICIFTVVLMPAATAALFHIAYLTTYNKQVKLKDFFYTLPKYLIKSTYIVFTFVLFSLLLLLNLRFYLSHFGILGIILAGISFWLLLLVLLMGVYIFPLICLGKGYKKTLQYSLLLVLNNLKFSLKFVLSTIILLGLEILLPIISIGLLAIFSQEAFLELQARYDQDIKITEPRRSFKELLKPWEFS